MSVAKGVSPRFKITGERLSEGKYHDISTFESSYVNPPSINDGNSVSVAMTKWIQPWPTWNFDKVAYPVYDGVCQFLGVPSNRPDFIKDYHFIGVMRNIDLYLAPLFKSVIVQSTDGASPAPPPTPSNTP